MLKPFDLQGLFIFLCIKVALVTELSDGYAAILDIVVDLMVRMEKHLNEGLKFDLPGIVLIDEIETHLHLEMQKNVLGFLENVFPNI